MIYEGNERLAEQSEQSGPASTDSVKKWDRSDGTTTSRPDCCADNQYCRVGEPDRAVTQPIPVTQEERIDALDLGGAKQERLVGGAPQGELGAQHDVGRVVLDPETGRGHEPDVELQRQPGILRSRRHDRVFLGVEGAVHERGSPMTGIERLPTEARA